MFLLSVTPSLPRTGQKGKLWDRVSRGALRGALREGQASRVLEGLGPEFRALETKGAED